MNDETAGCHGRRPCMPSGMAGVALPAGSLWAGCGGEAQIPLSSTAVVVAAPIDERSAPPRITTRPQPLIAGDGATAMFSVRVERRGPFAYQWQSEGVEIAGARGPALVIAAAQRANGGAHLRVVVSGADGPAVPEPVRLGVEPAGCHVP